MSNFEHVVQHTDYDCGAACVSILLKNAKINHSFLKLKDVHYTGEEYTLQDMKLLLNYYGISSEFFNYEGHHLEQDLSEIPTPFVALIERNGRGHYVVVHSVLKNSLIIGDPAQGKPLRMSINEFISENPNVFLVPEFANDSIQGVGEESNISRFSLRGFIASFLWNEQRPTWVKLIILSYIFIALSISNSFFMKWVLDDIIPNRNADLLTTLTFLFIFINIMIAIFSYIRAQIIVYFSNSIEFAIAKTYFQHLMKVKASFFYRQNSGDLISRYNDTSYIRDLMNRAVIGGVLDSSTALVVILIIFFLNPLFGIITLAAIVLFAFISYIMYAFIQKHIKNFLEEKAETNTYLISFLSNIQLINSLTKKGYFNEKIKAQVSAQLSSLFKVRSLENQNEVYKQLLLNLFLVFIIWLGVRNIFSGELSVGDLVLYTSLLGFLISSITNLVSFQVNYQEALAAIYRFKDILEYPAETPKEEILQQGVNSVIITDLSYSYNLYDPKICSINMEFSPGSATLIKGNNGSGKSTISKLIAGMIDPPAERIWINGQDVAVLNIDSVREEIAYINSETFFFQGSLRENLLLGANHSDEGIAAAVQAVEAEEIINKLPAGLDTVIHEGAAFFSAGEKQRLNLIRYLINKPSVIILDEALNNIDKEVKKKILAKLKEWKIILIHVSHDQEDSDVYTKVYTLRKTGGLTEAFTVSEGGLKDEKPIN